MEEHTVQLAIGGMTCDHYLREEGLEVRTGATIGPVSRRDGRCTVEVTTDGRREIFASEQLLVATGRRANTRGFGLDEAGIEQEARSNGVDVIVSTLPLSYVPRTQAVRERRGFVKLIGDRRTNRLVGAHILATEAGEMIQEPTLAIKYGLTIDDLAAAFHPYLTLAEGIKLAAQTFTRNVKKLSCCAA